MGWFRRPAIATGLALGVLIVIPALAPLPASFVDRGPGGDVRPTVFPFALAVFDPFVRSCVRGSLKAAALVAAGSLVLGIGLARIVTPWRFWGRRPLAALAMAPMVLPPWVGALGLRMLVGARSFEGPEGSTTAWLAWVWVELACGVPLVALATASAMARVEPATIDAARLAGAGRLRTWWQVVWPAVRHEALRGARTVFVLTLIEPGAPLLLGLRRTLAFQLVEAATGRDPFPRAAILSLEALGLALAANLVLRWLAGVPRGVASEVPIARPEHASWPRATGFVLALGAGAVLAWLPTWDLIISATSLREVVPHDGTPDERVLGASTLRRTLGHPGVLRMVAISLALGLLVVAVDLLIARSVAAWGRRRRGSRLVAAWLEGTPPLSLGVGALALPWLFALGASRLRAAGGPEFVARGLGSLSGWLDPVQSPGVLLVAAVAAVRLPALVRAAELARGRFRHVLVDSAITLGATTRHAYRAAAAGRLGVAPRVLILTFVLAATNLAPALVLEPTAEGQTLGPAVVRLADEPGNARSIATALATCVVVANLSALALAARGGPDSLGDWFRGGS